MPMKLIDLIAVIVVLFFIVSLNAYAGALIHEYTHYEVAERNGCTAKIVQPWNAGNGVFMSTYYVCPSNVSLEKVKQQQMQVETAGYQIIPLYLLVGMVIAVQIIILYLQKEQETMVVLVEENDL